MATMRTAIERPLPYNVEAEEAVLGSMLMDPDAISKVVSFLKGDDFYREKHAWVFQAIMALHGRDEPVDTLTVVDELERMGRLSDVGGPAAVTELFLRVPTAIHVEYYGRIVERNSILRKLIGAAEQIARLAYQETDADVAEIMDRAESLLFAISQRRLTGAMVPIREILAQFYDQVEHLFMDRRTVGLQTAFPDLDRLLGGFQRGDLVILAARPAMGKCVAYDTPIVDPRTGAVQTVADLFRRGRHGEAVEVLSLTANGELRSQAPSAYVDDGIKPVYRVRTRLGREVKTTLAHPFLTACGWRPLAKLQVGERVALPRELPVFGCEPLPRAELVLLAYLIGDGGLTESSPRFTTTSEYVLRDLEAHSASIGVALSPDIRPGRTPSYRLVTPRGQPNPLIDLVKEHGLWGKLAIEKTIPAAIYRLPKEQLALFLNRLFATDGSVWISREYGRISYASSSKALAQGVQHLLLRFGLNAKLREKRVRYKDQMRLAYEVELMAAVDILRFAREIGIFGKEEPLGRLVTLYETKEPGWTRDTLPTEVWDAVIEAKDDLRWSEVNRRAGKPVSHNWHVGKRSPRRETVMQLAGALGAPELHTWAQANIYWDEIAAIEYVGEEQVYDLTVPVTHNFVAADVYVHNTAFSLSITEQVALKYGARVAYFSLEMGADQVVARMVSSQTGIDVQRLRVGPIYEEDLERVGLAVDVLGRTRIFIDESPNVSPLEMRTKARRVASEHGLDLIVVDYLQLMRSETRNDNRVQEISYISRALKGLARELHVPVLALSQLSRSVESRQDKRPMLSDLRESGSIEQDADVVAFIYRDEVYNKNTERPNIAELIVAKHRNGPTGTIELRFTRENAKFSNLETLLDEDQMGPINGNNGSLDDIVF